MNQHTALPMALCIPEWNKVTTPPCHPLPQVTKIGWMRIFDMSLHVYVIIPILKEWSETSPFCCTVSYCCCFNCTVYVCHAWMIESACLNQCGCWQLGCFITATLSHHKVRIAIQCQNVKSFPVVIHIFKIIVDLNNGLIYSYRCTSVTVQFKSSYNPKVNFVVSLSSLCHPCEPKSQICSQKLSHINFSVVLSLVTLSENSVSSQYSSSPVMLGACFSICKSIKSPPWRAVHG